MRLKDGGSAIGGVPIARVKERNFEYLVYRMPFGGMTGLLGATPGELAKLFRRYGVPILVNKVDVDVGEEERI